MEGDIDIDTSHLGFPHLGAVKAGDAVPKSFDYYALRDQAPRYEVVDKDFGTSYRRVSPGRSRHVLLAHRPAFLPVLHGLSAKDRPASTRRGWLPFLDAYRTLCVAPPTEVRRTLSGLTH